MPKGNLIADATTTVTSSTKMPESPNRITGYTFQGVVVGTGAVSATVIIDCSNDAENWLTLGTITLSGTTTATDGFASVPWPCIRARVTAISGTGATVNVHFSHN